MNFKPERRLQTLEEMFGDYSSKSNPIKELLGKKESQVDVRGEATEVIEIEITRLMHFRQHPFKLYTGDRLQDMVDSIREHGILLPLIVRPIEKVAEKDFEILSGHNRANAAMLVGLEKVPCIIRTGLNDEEATLIVTETNLRQRSFNDLSHSERAAVITQHYNAIKQQGKRKELLKEIELLSSIDNFNDREAFRQFGEKSTSASEAADKYDISARVVSRYLRIDKLVSELKEKLDKGEIPLIAAVDISFLKLEEQIQVVRILESNGYKIDLKKAEMLKSLSKGHSLTEQKIQEILSGKYFEKVRKKPKAVKIKAKLLSKYFRPEQKSDEIEKIIEEALDLYFQNREMKNEGEET